MGAHAPIRNQNGEVVGIWLENPEDAKYEEFLRMATVSYTKGASELYVSIREKSFKIFPNKVDSKGGCFLMIPDVLPPGMSPKEVKVGFWENIFSGNKNSYTVLIEKILEDPNSVYYTKIAITEFGQFWHIFLKKIESSKFFTGKSSIEIFNNHIKGSCPDCGTSITGEYIAKISAYKQAAGVLGISNEMKQFLVGNCGVCQSKIYTVTWTP